MRSNWVNNTPPPPTPLGEGNVQTGVDQTAQQRRVSLPPSGMSPGDRRDQGLLFPTVCKNTVL